MRELLAHASTLGVKVHVAHLPPEYRGYYDADRRMVVYGFDLTHIERRCVLAHELGHAFYDHRGHGHKDAEDAADRYAADLLIDPERYAQLEAVYPSAEMIAEELAVTTRMLGVFQQSSLTRLDGVTYSRRRSARRTHRWFH